MIAGSRKTIRRISSQVQRSEASSRAPRPGKRGVTPSRRRRGTARGCAGAVPEESGRAARLEDLGREEAAHREEERDETPIAHQLRRSNRGWGRRVAHAPEEPGDRDLRVGERRVEGDDEEDRRPAEGVELGESRAGPGRVGRIDGAARRAPASRAGRMRWSINGALRRSARIHDRRRTGTCPPSRGGVAGSRWILSRTVDGRRGCTHLHRTSRENHVMKIDAPMPSRERSCGSSRSLDERALGTWSRRADRRLTD